MKRGIIEENEHEQPAGTSSEPETTAQGVEGRKGKRTKKFTGSDENVSFKSGTVLEDDVLLIAYELGPSWKVLGRLLDVPDALIHQIEANGSELSEECYNVLTSWKERYPKDATYHRLARALKHPAVGREDLAVKYCGLQLASDEEKYVVDEGDESNEKEEEEEEEDQQHEYGKPTKKKEKKTGKDTGSSIPAEIRRRGAGAERAFQKAMQTGRKVKVYRGRIMLLGQDRAGKTSLRRSLLGLPFDPKEESTVGVEFDEVENWMPIERKKGEDRIARFIFRGLLDSDALDNDSTAADPNVEEVKEPKLSPDGDEPGTEEIEVGHKANLVDKNELSNELQLNINFNFTDPPEDDVKSEVVNLTLWDFAGQHLYYASHSVFLSGRAVYILVYNLNKNLLATAEPCVRQGLSDNRLDNPNNETNLDNLFSWLVSVHNIRSAAKENVAHQQTELPYQRPPVIIVGTNLDQPFEELATTEKRIKDSIIGKEFAKHVITTFFAVDNSTENNEGVRKLRDKIMEVLKREPYMPEEVPLRWFNFERAVDALVAKQTYFMDLDQLLSVIRQDCHIEDEEEVTTMLNFYHDLGVIVKHGQTVVLQVQWLINLFKQLITVPPFEEAIPLYVNCWRELEVNGILREALVDGVFSKFIDKALCKQDILSMMEQHGLVAKFSIATDENQDEQRYFVPTQLRSPPSKLYEIKPCECDPCPLILHFLDGFVPHGLFPQLMSKFIHWGSKNGLKETPQLFSNLAKLFIGKLTTFSLTLICKKRFIKIVLKTRNPSSSKPPSMNASNKMAIEVRNFIETTLDGFSRDLSWLSNLRYELNVVCTHCQQCECDLHKKTSCDQDDCLHLLQVWRGKELICTKNLSDETDPAPGWEKWFELPHSQIKEAKDDISEAVGTSSEPETTTQRVKGTKRKRNKNFTDFSPLVAPKKKRGIFEKNKSGQPAGTSSESETTAQRVEQRKRKRKKNFTGHFLRASPRGKKGIRKKVTAEPADTVHEMQHEISASDEEEYDVDDGEESSEEEKDEEEEEEEEQEQEDEEEAEEEEDEEEEEEEEDEEEDEEEEEEEDQQLEQGKPTLIKKRRKTEKVSKILEDLVDDASDFLVEICQRLDTRTAGLCSYENIAKHYRYKSYTIRSRFEKSPDGPSKALIYALIAEHPDVTVESFAKVVVKRARRKDVAKLLREFDRK